MKYYRLLIQFICLVLLTVFLSSCSTLGTNDLANLPGQYQQVALLLPLHGRYGGPGQAIRNGFLAGYYSALRAGMTSSKIRVYDTSKTNNITSVYKKAIAQGADLVIGPLSKNKVKTLIENGNITVPTICLNYIQDLTPPKLLFEFGISPQNEAKQIANKAYKAGLSKAIIITPKAQWGQNIAKAFAQQWQSLGGTVVTQFNYTQGSNLRYKISDLLKVNKSYDRGRELERILGEKVTFVPQRRKDFNVIFLVAPPASARQIMPLLRFYYAGNIPVYSISMIYKGTQDINFNRDMNGVIFSDIPWVFTPSASQHIQSNLNKLWPHDYKNYVRLYALGLDAFMLSQKLNQVPINPDDGLPGETGRIFLGPNHQILQTFVWGKIRKGKAILISNN